MKKINILTIAFFSIIILMIQNDSNLIAQVIFHETFEQYGDGQNIINPSANNNHWEIGDSSQTGQNHYLITYSIKKNGGKSLKVSSNSTAYFKINTIYDNMYFQAWIRTDQVIGSVQPEGIRFSGKRDGDVISYIMFDDQQHIVAQSPSEAPMLQLDTLEKDYWYFVKLVYYKNDTIEAWIFNQDSTLIMHKKDKRLYPSSFDCNYFCIFSNAGGSESIYLDDIEIGKYEYPNDVKEKNISYISNFEIFPNPSSDYINVDFKNNIPINDEVEIYNILGNLVKKVKPNFASSLQIDVLGFPKGIYFVRIGESNKVFVKE